MIQQSRCKICNGFLCLLRLYPFYSHRFIQFFHKLNHRVCSSAFAVPETDYYIFSKGGFVFASVGYLDQTLDTIEKMPENTVEQIVKKYVEMNVAHPFMEGNGRTTRIWLDLILKKNLFSCVDWSKIDKTEYLEAMKLSVVDYSDILSLIENALTDKIDDREIFMKGIDYSYYYEEEL